MAVTDLFTGTYRPFGIRLIEASADRDFGPTNLRMARGAGAIHDSNLPNRQDRQIRSR